MIKLNDINKGSTAGFWFSIIAIFGGMLLIVALQLNSNASAEHKEPVTPEQVYNILSEQGYDPRNITELYIEKDPDWDMLNSIAAEDNDMRFEFFVFESEKSAVKLFNQAKSLIAKENTRMETVYEHENGNYAVYTFRSKEKYNAAVRVGNTAVYAYCSEKDDEKIVEILNKIGYADLSITEKESKTLKRQGEMSKYSVFRLIVFGLIFYVNRLSSKWLYRLLIKESGISMEEIAEEWSRGAHYAQHWFASQVKKSYKASRIRNIYYFCTVPCVISFNLAVIGLFTENLDKFLMCAGAFLIIQNFGLIIARAVYFKKNRE